MKRFIAYLLLSFSILTSVFIGFIPTFSNVNASGDYAQGREFIYQISLKDNDLNYINGTSSYKEEGSLATDIDDIVVEFKSRLEKANVSNPVVEVLNNKDDNSQAEKMYSIRVAYKVQYDQLYSAINSYLTFDWNLSVSITKDPFNFSQYVDNTNTNQESLFKRGQISLDTSDAAPVIKIPLADPQSFNDNILKVVTGEESSSSTQSIKNKISMMAEEGEEESGPTTDDYIYIVNNWADKYDIKKAVEDSSYISNATNNIIFKLDTTNLSSMFYDYDANDASKVCEILKVDYTQYCPDLSNITDSAVLQRVVNQIAQIQVNKLNSTSYKYSVSLLNENYPALTGSGDGTNNIPALVEQLKSQGKLVFSSLVAGTIAAFILVSLFLALNYGLSAFLGSAIVSATTLLSATLLSIFGVEFNIGTIIGLIIVSIIGVFTVSIYFKKIREACYAGKNLKKAFSDGGKKTVLYHLDVSAVTLIFGIVGYVSNNIVITSLGAVLILGGILNFVLAVCALRPVYWLLLNSSFVEKRLYLLRIDEKIIPDLSKDEKPTYFDSFKTKPATKKSKLISSIVFGLLLVASIVILPVSNAISGNIYGSETTTAQNSQIYITYKVLQSEDSLKGIASDTKLKETVLDKIYTFSPTAEGNKGDKLKYGDIKSMYTSKIINEEGNIELSFTYIIQLNSIVSSETTYFYEGSPESNNSLNELISSLVFSTLSSEFNTSNISSHKVYLLQANNLSTDNLNVDLIVYAAISIGITCIYILLRHGLGKTVISFMYVAGSSTISLGIFSALRASTASSNTLGIVIIAIITYAMALLYFTSRKELLKENKNLKFDQNYLEKRKELLLTHHSLTYNTLITIVAISILVLMSFLVSKTFTGIVIIISLLGIFLSLLMLKYFTMPLEELDENLFELAKRKINFNFFKKKGNKKDKDDKGDGPQEAIFIGIND